MGKKEFLVEETGGFFLEKAEDIPSLYSVCSLC